MFKVHPDYLHKILLVRQISRSFDRAAVVCFGRKEVRPVTKEYLLLFNAITDAAERLEQLREQLLAVQCAAEELYITREDPPAPAE